MKTLQETLSDAKAKYEKEVAGLLAIECGQKTMKDSMPEVDGITFDRAHQFGAYVDLVAEFNAVDIATALYFGELVNPDSAFRVKDSCLAFKPESAITERDENHATIDAIGPWYLTAKTMRHRETEWTLHMFTNINGVSFELRINIDASAMRKDGYSVRYSYKHPSKYHPEGRVEDCTVIYPRDHFTQSNRFWSSEGQPNNFTIY